ncbi:MAG: Smr/MutS family protein [Deltaproteobacteria bacterium]|nr:Smr/MutS family protein [Deltaproteobacteria bacterium]
MEKKKPFNDAFSELAKVKQKLTDAAAAKEREAQARIEAAQARDRPRTKESDDDAFLKAMSGVRRMEPDGKGEVVRKPAAEKIAQAARAADEEVDALVDLASAIDPESALEANPGELFAARGLDARIVKRLMKGGFPLDAQVDLHGLRRIEAERKVESFIKQSRAQKLRAVLVITGRGLNSEAGGPVLKDAVHRLLTKGALVRFVLAVAPAIPEHGGEGACYVLLRRR